ncbi:DEAD/DEAH box helicase [uncultured Mucilaginibacter sp.]|uniref:DEAD/DEAH box helicase n=1 Tax=uncultured Mucilaginibacter sp. TaxID=797541 RepID=UPI0025F99FF3|nr:DEAD/DEAH box helicase [uncultured Mucilaginibacter sp.]
MIKEALAKLNIAELNQMQHAALNADVSRDMVLLSPTGSGKTLGFLLPVLKTLDPAVADVQVLIMVPSRELALQIEQVFKTMGTGFKINCCYGGHDTKVERNNLSQPPAILVGTPGRIAYHIKRSNFKTDAIKTLVLDEFDKALEFGFENDMSYIIRNLVGLQRRILTSATQMDNIPAFAGVKAPVELNFLKRDTSASALQLKAVITEPDEKLETLFKLICTIGSKVTLVFCNHRDAVDRISELLWDMRVIHDVFHGGMEQEDREKALIKFRNGSSRLLITTDLASRGLDIPEIEYIIHYQVPHNKEAFTHRNGRTARMHAKGTAYLLLTPDERPDFLEAKYELETLPERTKLPEPTPWATLYIAAGKKDKVNKVDIVGLLLQKGKLNKDELGLIEVLDYSSYAAVNRKLIAATVDLIKNEKIKNKKVKIDISR